MTDRKTDRELLDELERANIAFSLHPLRKEIVSRFRDLLDRVDIVNDRAELHPIPEKSQPGALMTYRHGVDVGYAKGCQHCKEDLSDGND